MPMRLAILLCAGFVTYVYVLYPLAVWAIGRLAPFRARITPVREWVDPRVTVVVAVRNEEKNLQRKLKTLRALEYDPSKLKVIFVSDGSTDATNSILAATDGITFLSYPQAMGKAHALNVARQHVDSEIVFFTDARQELEPLCLKRLVQRFQDPTIGAVSGELMHRAPGSTDGAQIGMYWRYEKWIRHSESRLDSTVGATGACYAIRADLWTELPPDSLIDDFLIPMHVVKRGFRVVTASDAIAWDELEKNMEGEFKRKVRTLAGNFQALARNTWLLGRQNRLRWQYISHKLFRLLVPYALVGLLLGTAIADEFPYKVIFSLQCAFYGLAAAGWLVRQTRGSRVVSFCYAFTSLNVAAVYAFYRFAVTNRMPLWEK